MDYEKLDELSRRFAESLFAVFPAWRGLATAGIDSTTGCASIEVRIPQEGSGRFLHIETANNEITIAFDEWHTHIGPFLGISVGESVTTAINIIRSFVTEEAVVQVVYQHGAWKQSGMHYLAAPSETVLQATTKIYSWKHTYDQVIES